LHCVQVTTAATVSVCAERGSTAVLLALRTAFRRWSSAPIKCACCAAVS
jgi:hypothetical protein